MRKKTKKIILYSIFAIVIAGIGYLVVIGGENNENVASFSASALSVVEASYDFQTISMMDGNVTHEFKLHNEGEEPVIIEKVYTSCMCTEAKITDASGKTYGAYGMPGHGISPKTHIEIMPGESATVEAIFDPAAHGPSGVGLAQRSIYLETNSATSPKQELKFQAMVSR